MRKSNTAHTRLWRKHYGEIPRDENGVSYEVHHINGNPNDNRIENLVCVSITEHFEIHKRQEDWNACNAIAARMNISAEEKSELARKAAYERIEIGTHNFGSDHSKRVQKKLLQEGKHVFQREGYHKEIMQKMRERKSHNFFGGEIQKKTNERRVKEGTHNFIGENNPSHNRVKNGTHNFQDRDAAKNRALKANSRPVVEEIRSIQKKYRLKLGSGWSRRTDEFLDLLLAELKDKYCGI